MSRSPEIAAMATPKKRVQTSTAPLAAPAPARRRPVLLAGVLAALALAVGAAVLILQPGKERPVETAPPVAPPTPPAERLKVEVVATHPHDPEAYTQGLLWHDGALYESTGQYGSSSLRRVKLETGEVTRFTPLPQGFFGEGLALVDDRLIQLTWREEKAFVYRLSSFDKLAELRYEGEGWGLCYDGRRLVMSDGSSRLRFRDPATLAVQGEVEVKLDGAPLFNLNELECLDGAVYANVWTEDRIVRIDPASGRVTAVVDASGLLTAEEKAAGTEVLNGIAWHPEKKVFLLTGKLWPRLFEARFVPAA